MAQTGSASKRTTDHEEIKKWVEAHGGHPSRVKGTEDKEGGGLLRIDFPGYSGEGRLEEISWDEFFQEFEESDLEFLYQEHTKDGKDSRFNKLIHRGGDHDGHEDHKADHKADHKPEHKADHKAEHKAAPSHAKK